jgi:pimeloyl-ACP methyl ester carboxylesterase
MKEEALVLTRPSDIPAASSRPGIVLLNAGLVHRVGPNRLTVKLARRVAASGFHVLRFDLGGIGDSAPRQDGLPFPDSAVSETREALDYLGAGTGIRHFVLMGICAGASIAFRAAIVDRRIRGLVLINVRTLDIGSEDRLSLHTRHWADSQDLLRPRLLVDLARRKVGVRRTLKVLGSRIADQTRREALAKEADRLSEKVCSLTGREVALLLVSSFGDSAFEYQRLLFDGRRQCASCRELLIREVLHGADHTFTPLSAQERLSGIILAWLHQHTETDSPGELAGGESTAGKMVIKRQR